MVKVLRSYIDKVNGIICTRNLFPDKPIIEFYPNKAKCCGLPLHVQKSQGKTIVTLDIGAFYVKETVFECCSCGEKYRSEELQKLAPSGCNFGYEVLVYVGEAVFLHNRNDREIIQELWPKNIIISSSEIAYLAKKFIVYLALAHRENRKKIRKAMDIKGGYILHLDSKCEADSPHLMCGLDGISEIVLDNIKIPSESTEKIVPFLMRIKKDYGNPRAIVSDMSKGILGAVKQVFSDILDFVCHFHFLRDIGKDLFGKENDVMRNRLKHYGIQGLLLKNASKFKKIIEQRPDLDGYLSMSLENGKIKEEALVQMPMLTAYTMIHWALDGKNQGSGYGFPLDRLYLVFYQRLNTLYRDCNKLQEVCVNSGVMDSKPFFQVCKLLQEVISDNTLCSTALQMQEKACVFDKLREAMRIADPEQNLGLNDDGEDVDIKTIEKQVRDFRQWLVTDDRYLENKEYQKMVEQIDKYWEKLFADPIIVDTPSGKVKIQPQRTNNVLERLFRDISRNYRKKSGTNSMGKTLKAILSDMPLVKNLKNQEYVNIILNGKETLEERFAEIDAKMVREELKKSQEDSEKIPNEIKKIIKKTQLPESLVQLFINQLAR